MISVAVWLCGDVAQCTLPVPVGLIEWLVPPQLRCRLGMCQRIQVGSALRCSAALHGRPALSWANRLFNPQAYSGAIAAALSPPHPIPPLAALHRHRVAIVVPSASIPASQMTPPANLNPAETRKLWHHSPRSIHLIKCAPVHTCVCAYDGRTRERGICYHVSHRLKALAEGGQFSDRVLSFPAVDEVLKAIQELVPTADTVACMLPYMHLRAHTRAACVCMPYEAVVVPIKVPEKHLCTGTYPRTGGRVEG